MTVRSEKRLRSPSNLIRRNNAIFSVGALLSLTGASVMVAQFVVKDPGVCNGSIDSGGALASVASTAANDYFLDSKSRFQEVESVANGAHTGLGPRFNSNSCTSCHAQPAVGGSSPSAAVFPFLGPNPETLVTTLNPTQNPLPPFITIDGPA
jgi:hypothetical protein